MLILSNALTNVADEGCVKVAGSLVKRLKTAEKNTYIVTYEMESEFSDTHLTLNKFLWNRSLHQLIKRKKEPFLYLPFPSKPIAFSLRLFLLSFFAKYGFRVLVTMQGEMNFLSRLLLKMSRADIVALSKESCKRFSKIVGERRVTYLKTGVDTNKFQPVSQETVEDLKIKYGFDPQKPVVLHVGHLKAGRNIEQLMKLEESYQVLLVTSTLFQDQQDLTLKERLLQQKNIRMIDEYLPNIEEVYQLSDVYFFPVVEQGNCIDVPLSCMEAAACNKPIITTTYGEMKEFQGKNGFWFLESFDREYLNRLLQQVLQQPCDTRACVMEYDWDKSVEALQKQ